MLRLLLLVCCCVRTIGCFLSPRFESSQHIWSANSNCGTTTYWTVDTKDH